MLKRLIVALLVLSLAVFAFAACGNTVDSGDDVVDTDVPAGESESESETEAPQCNGVDIHAVVVEEKAATCKDRGYKIESCSICGEIVSETASPKVSCTPVAAVTCTADSVCAFCGDVLEAAPGHVFGEATVIAATCLADGSKTQTCTTCGETVVEPLAKLAHNIPDENVTASVEATCDSEGSKTGLCTLCNQTQMLVIPAAHVIAVEDLSAITFVDGAIKTTCVNCGKNVENAGEVRLVLTFDGEDVTSEVTALATAENGLSYAEVYNGDQGGESVLPPRIEKHEDAADGHTSVLLLPHNRSASINFNGSLLADSKYTLISFDWRITQVGNSSRKIAVIGQADMKRDGATSEGNYAVAFQVDRSNGVLYTADNAAGAFELTAEAGKWYKIVIVVDNEAGQAATYIDGQFYALSTSTKWTVSADGEYSWRLGGIYNLFHRPEVDNFTVSVVK